MRWDILMLRILKLFLNNAVSMNCANDEGISSLPVLDLIAISHIVAILTYEVLFGSAMRTLAVVLSELSAVTYHKKVQVSSNKFISLKL